MYICKSQNESAHAQFLLSPVKKTRKQYRLCYWGRFVKFSQCAAFSCETNCLLLTLHITLPSLFLWGVTKGRFMFSAMLPGCGNVTKKI